MKFNKMKSNCYFLEINNKFCILISYESIIGFIFNNKLYLSEKYLNFSVTTKKHIKIFEQNLNFNEKYIISENDFINFFKKITIENENYLKMLLKTFEK